jgi:5-deoxy-glucuronate isomerase
MPDQRSRRQMDTVALSPLARPVAETAPDPVAPPNHLPTEVLHLVPDDGGRVTVEPATAGWRYLSFRALRLRAGTPLEIPDDGQESALVVLGGGGLRVEPASSPALDLEGRRSVWDGLPWAAYLPAGTGARVVALPADDRDGWVELALARAPGAGREGAGRAPILIGPDDCAIETRGAGNATRQITHIVRPDFPAQRLLLVEVYTPSGNWSSWPPHKHDEDAMPGEAVLEEIYCYRFRRPEDWAIQRLYRRPGTPLHRSSGPRDGIWAVRSGDVVLVTDGYHPFVATHGADAYYLNALAGGRRTMACSFDPDFDHVRAAWPTMPTDPRVPLVDRSGPRVVPPGDPAGHA